MAKISLSRAKALVDQLGVLDDFMSQCRAEAEFLKEQLHPFKGQTLVTDEYQSTVTGVTPNNLDRAKLLTALSKLTGSQKKAVQLIARCMVKGEESIRVSIKPIGVKKKDRAAQAKVNVRKSGKKVL